MSWASNWRVLEAGAAWSLVARRKRRAEMVKAFIVDALGWERWLSCFMRRKCEIDEQGSQLSGMRVSLYIFENSQERDARLHCCSVFHSPRYHVPKRSSSSTSSIRGGPHVGVSGQSKGNVQRQRFIVRVENLCQQSAV